MTRSRHHAAWLLKKPEHTVVTPSLSWSPPKIRYCSVITSRHPRGGFSMGIFADQKIVYILYVVRGKFTLASM